MARRQPNQYNWEKMEFDEMLMTKHFTPSNRTNIEYFTVHHMIILNRDMKSADANEACRRVWQTREASAHYGVDGDFVAQFVYDRNIAWANGNSRSNRATIAIEHANATLDEPGTNNDYVIDDRTFFNGAKLIAYGHHLYNKKPIKNVTVRRHGEFFATACPGPYFNRNFSRYQDLMHDMYNEIKLGKHDFIVPETPQHSVPQKGKLTTEQVATEVINGVWGNDPERSDKLRAAGYDPAAVQNLVNEKLNGRPKQDTADVVTDVINGKYGNGAERHRRLLAAGFNANEIQSEVNRRLSGGSTGKSISQLATEVINGAWGNNPDRHHRLIAAGYDAAAIQAEVNRRLG